MSLYAPFQPSLSSYAPVLVLFACRACECELTRKMKGAFRPVEFSESTVKGEGGKEGAKEI